MNTIITNVRALLYGVLPFRFEYTLCIFLRARLTRFYVVFVKNKVKSISVLFYVLLNKITVLPSVVDRVKNWSSDGSRFFPPIKIVIIDVFNMVKPVPQNIRSRFSPLYRRSAYFKLVN